MATDKTCRHEDARTYISGTDIREVLGGRQRPAAEKMRDELYMFLMDEQRSRPLFCEEAIRETV